MADSLTDAELRKRLTSLGYDVGPLNASTRPLWLKKIGTKPEPKKVAKAVPKPPTSKKAAIGFSSDESEDDAAKLLSARGKSRVTRSKSAPRARTKEVATPPTSLARPSLRRRAVNNVPRAKEQATKPVTPKEDRHSILDSTFTLDESDTGNDTDAPAAALSVSTNTSATTEQHLNTPEMATSATKREPRSRPLSTSTPDKNNSNSKLSYLGKTGAKGAPKFSRCIDRSDQFIPVNSSGSKTGKYGGNAKVKRQKLDSSFDDSLSDEDEIIQQGFQTRESVAYSWTQYISVILVVVLTCFFLLLGATYLNLRGEAQRSDSAQKDSLMVCEGGAISNNVGETGKCFTSVEVSQALAALKPLYNVLSTNAGKHDCGHAAEYKHRYLTRLEVSKLTTFQGNNLMPMLHLIMNNEHWNIRLLGKQQEQVTDPNEVWFVESTAPYYPIVCRAKMFCKRMLNWIIGLALFVVAMFVLWFLYKCDQKKKSEERVQVYDVVDNIIEVLKAQHDLSQDNKDVQPYMAIPHVRDMLIPPHERSLKQSIWDQAVKFLAANESRIRVETQVISGEEFPVWRWLHGYASNTSKGKKMWQGQAFGESPSGRANTLPFSPTPCLKIRNLFDPNIEVGEWDIGICDVILEKCQDINDIVHISVDKTSPEGCIYLKCASPAGAGKVYKALHGWWFDGNLVTVKFLRLERYHERFPDSSKCKTPLKPSSAQSSWFSTL